MTRFLIRRLIQSALLLWAIMTLTFLLVHVTPGGPDAILVDNPRATEEMKQRLRERYGLDQPLGVQYVRWLGGVLVGDFGRSYSNAARPVLDVIGERAWASAQLGLLAYAIGMVGIPIGIFAALRRGRVGDTVVRVFTVIGHAVPTWWLALSIIVLMNSLIGWFPNGQGRGSPWEWFKYIILPAALLGIGGVITFSRYVRSEVLEIGTQDYIRTARAKGLPRQAVTWGHIMRNALMPVVTILGALLPAVLGGAVITETIFNWPGMGRLFFEAASTRDYPLLLGILLIGTFLTILGTLIADLLYGVVDPRIRYS
ncbi:MAG: ABC transporter permease [Chloroflexi bacterium]|nr:ABC transporter permease [Chloroflexota bacterium]